ncbi:MAG TPA: hypothetical protein VM778_12420 [Gemmatimonadota bacterium]|nr:hypothetical protein [Gemmatimonadota bacterium]
MRRAPPGLLAALVAISCSQRVEPEESYVEGESGRPVLPAGMTPPALSGGQGRAAMTRTIPDEPSPGALRGRIEGPADGAASPDAVLFLFVRAAGASGGPPLAVQRHPSDALPLEFAIGPESAMIAGTTFPELVTVEARLDQDGNAMTEGPDDRVARSEPVAPGTGGIVLPLARP